MWRLERRNRKRNTKGLGSYASVFTGKETSAQIYWKISRGAKRSAPRPFCSLFSLARAPKCPRKVPPTPRIAAFLYTTSTLLQTQKKKKTERRRPSDGEGDFVRTAGEQRGQPSSGKRRGARIAPRPASVGARRTAASNLTSAVAGSNKICYSSVISAHSYLDPIFVLRHHDCIAHPWMANFYIIIVLFII